MSKHPKFCTKCGAPLDENARFCTKCGSPVPAPEPEPAPPEQTPPPAPKPPAGPRKGLLAGIIAAVVVLAAVIAAVFLLGGPKDSGADPASSDSKGADKSAPSSQAAASQSSAQAAEELTLQVTQVDTHDYPKVQLYFQLRDLNGNLVDTLTNPVLRITEDGAQAAEVVPQTLQSTQKNICFVLDISGSMLDQNKYIYGRDAILQLLDSMEGDANYQAALLSFNDSQNTLEDFTSAYANMREELNAISPSGQTAFWDSLEHALLRTNSQSGQKCIVAATDGMDNASVTTRDNVVDLSLELQIPIYIITLDASLESDLTAVAQATGGDCFTVSDVQQLSGIYNSILLMQSSQFVVSFTSDGKTTEAERGLSLVLSADGCTAQAAETYHCVGEIYAGQISNAIISSVTASSHLEEYYQSTGQLSHVPENTIDGSYRTAWVENAAGDGIGEWIKLDFDRTYAINGIEISNGYKKSAELYEKNSRLSRVRLHFSDGSYQDYDLDDTFEGAQRLTFPKPVTTNSITLEILSVYPGSKYQDTCITELQVF